MEIQRLSNLGSPQTSRQIVLEQSDTPNLELENKSAERYLEQEPAGEVNNLMEAFSAFRQANDERLGQLERNSAVDAVTEDKVNRINEDLDHIRTRLDTLSVSANRPALGVPCAGAEFERKSAFDAYVRHGDSSGYATLSTKGLTTDPTSSTGYSVPIDLETEIGRRLAEISPIRSISSVRETTSGIFKKPFAISGFTTGWAAETDSRSQTTEASIEELSYPAMELYAMPAASTTLIEDSAVDVEAWVVQEVQYAFAEQESTAFISGDGSAKPRGLLNYATVDNASWAWGKIGTVPSGASGGFASSASHDALIDLTHALKSGYRANGTFVMNRNTLAEVRKLKDSSGHYLWQPSRSVGDPSSLMGFPIVESEDMPDIAAGSTSIAFGDFKRGYLIVDRRGVTVLRDPFTAKPWILFYVSKRVGGGVQDFDAIKLMKFSVS